MTTVNMCAPKRSPGRGEPKLMGLERDREVSEGGRSLHLVTDGRPETPKTALCTDQAQGHAQNTPHAQQWRDTFSPSVDRMLGHKTRLSELKRILNIQRTFSGRNVIKLKINNRRKFGKFTSMKKIENMLLTKRSIRQTGESCGMGITARSGC